MRPRPHTTSLCTYNGIATEYSSRIMLFTCDMAWLTVYCVGAPNEAPFGRSLPRFLWLFYTNGYPYEAYKSQ